MTQRFPLFCALGGFLTTETGGKRWLTTPISRLRNVSCLDHLALSTRRICSTPGNLSDTFRINYSSALLIYYAINAMRCDYHERIAT